MGSFKLVRGKGTHSYPASVVNLVNFVKENARLWPVVADYVREVHLSLDKETWQGKFRLLTRKYGLDKPKYSEQCGRLWSLLEELYALSDRDLDPRTLFLEYLLYVVGPCTDALRESANLQREYQCSLWWRAANGTARKVVKSEATFDVAFLCCGGFEGLECKVKMENYVPYGKDITQWESGFVRKLAFMKQTHTVVLSVKMPSRVYLIGLDRELDPIEQSLRRNGYGCVQPLGPDQLAQLFG